MEITTELINMVKNAESPEEILKIAQENDAPITLENAKMIFMTLQNSNKNK